ncbi:50S ribosomal protein L2 [Candidatus Peregrinibacteria bacterium]|nr:50S ribosomal protein L2 [Candidatus Peregrinibacteria bacterium]
MPIKIIKPNTPGQRNMSVLTFEEITKSKPEKRLTKRLMPQSGRNNQGKITVHHQGGGTKQKYRFIDFNQTEKLNIAGIVKAVEYDPNRTSFIMLVFYKDGDKRYHVAPEGIKVEDTIVTAEKAKLKTGNRMQVKNIPTGFAIHNIEFKPGKGGKIIRSAGSSAQVAAIEGDMALINLPSGEMRAIPKDCYASVGVVSNIDHSNVTIGKAGRMRHMGVRPTVRGKAKNPVDHPHGGGEGNQPIGLKHPKTPWGKPAMGVKTRKKKYSDKYIMKSRHLKKK